MKVHAIETSLQDIYMTTQKSIKLSEGQQIQQLRTSNHSLILFIVKLLFIRDLAELNNAICILYQVKHQIFK